MAEQTAVRLPEELAEEAEAVARVKGTSVNALIVESLPEFFWLSKQVTGIEADVLATPRGINLADSALHAPQASFGG